MSVHMNRLDNLVCEMKPEIREETGTAIYSFYWHEGRQSYYAEKYIKGTGRGFNYPIPESLYNRKTAQNETLAR